MYIYIAIFVIAVLYNTSIFNAPIHVIWLLFEMVTLNSHKKYMYLDVHYPLQYVFLHVEKKEVNTTVIPVVF